jgi:hypothetical protein
LAWIERGKVLDDAAVARDVAQLATRELPQLTGRVRVDRHEAIASRIRQRPKEHSLNDRDDRDTRGNHERECRRDRAGKGRLAHQASACMAEIRKHGRTLAQAGDCLPRKPDDQS